MSSFLSSPDTLAALVTYWHDSCQRPGSFLQPIGELGRALCCVDQAHGDTAALRADLTAAAGRGVDRDAVCRLAYRWLFLANVQALADRYGDRAFPDDDVLPRYVFRRSAWAAAAVRSGRTGALYGLLRGYVYQACDAKAWGPRMVAWQVAEQIRHLLTADWERRCVPNDRERLWAGWEEPAATDAAAVQAVSLVSLLGG